MKGLLFKDLYMTWKYCKPFLLIVVMFTCLSGFVDNAFVYVYPAVFVAMIPFTLGAYDERSKWNIYCDSLPVSRKTVVSSKYLFSLIAALTVVFLSVISMVTSMLMESKYDINQLFSFFAIILLLSFSGTSVLLPVYFRFGTEKARIIYLVIVALVSGISVGFGFVTGVKVFNANPITIVIISTVIYVLSWLLSIRLYENREL